MMNKKPKILLIEDSKLISKGLVYSFEQNGYAAAVCETFDEALAAAPFDFDLIIIDISLPDGNGFELYEIIKKVCDSPIIFLTALDDEDSVVKGLELGADDYITKPFSTRELLARMKRLIIKREEPEILKFGEISVDLDKKTVFRNGKELEFTALEYKIFSMLVQNSGQIVTREQILERIWDIAGNYVNDNTLTVYIKRVRAKLGTDIIKTVKGLGYKLKAEDENEDNA